MLRDERQRYRYRQQLTQNYISLKVRPALEPSVWKCTSIPPPTGLEGAQLRVQVSSGGQAQAQVSGRGPPGPCESGVKPSRKHPRPAAHTKPAHLVPYALPFLRCGGPKLSPHPFFPLAATHRPLP